MTEAEEVRGKRVLIRFDAKRCVHSRHCVLDRPDVFVPHVKGEWIHPDAAPPDAVVAVAHACPSGAITYERLDGAPGEAAPGVNTLRIRENGPLALHAELTIDGHPAGYRATLCRCGASKNKPYCDGSHAAAAFVASGEPATEESARLTARNGPITVQSLPKGPLRVDGNLEICTGTGRTIARTQRAFLCRCGASANKPYCDGTHSKVGFSGE
jgi:CDGSH-type Zn-finger protein/uncharacterized Fe-S cluster protein YjdI